MIESSVVIVGHGHSLTGAKLGEKIDQHPVVRMKLSKRLMDESPEDYGKRTDYASSTTAVILGVCQMFKAREYWAYIKAGRPSIVDQRDRLIEKKIAAWKEKEKNGKKYELDRYYFRERKILLFKEIHWKWLDVYYRIRGNEKVRYSTGMASIITALEHLKPEKLYLAGMDAVTDPEKDWSSTLSRKQYDWKNDPPHDFRCENILLDKLKEHYCTQVLILS